MALTPKDNLIEDGVSRVIVISLVVFRIYTRLRYGKRHRLIASDWFLIAAETVAIIDMALSMSSIRLLIDGQNLINQEGLRSKFSDSDFNGIGAVTILPTNQQIRFFKLLYVDQVATYSVLWLTKGAFLALYMDVIQAVPTRLRWFIWLSSIYTVLTYIVVILVSLLWCLPVSTEWDVSNELANLCTAWGERDPIVIIYVLNITTDLLIIMIPIELVRQLPAYRRHKWGILFLGVIASLSLVGSIIRFIEVFINISDSILISVMTDMEENIARFALCLPAFKMFFRNARVFSGPFMSSTWGTLMSWGGSRKSSVQSEHTGMYTHDQRGNVADTDTKNSGPALEKETDRII